MTPVFDGTHIYTADDAGNPLDSVTKCTPTDGNGNFVRGDDEVWRYTATREPVRQATDVVLGDVLFFKRDYIGAERELSKAKRINPKSPPARLILADVLTYQDSKQKREQAVKESRDALDLFKTVSEKKVSAARALKGLSISHLIFGGGRFRNDAAMAEAQHMLGKTLTRVVYFDDTITNPDVYLDEARTHLTEAARLAQNLNDKARLALVLDDDRFRALLVEALIRCGWDAQRAAAEGWGSTAGSCSTSGWGCWPGWGCA